MAQKAASFSKKAEATATPRPPSEPPRPLPPIPLDLAPLVAPFKSRGRITLRIERMPQRARLSAGRNNGDNSWSLGTDEIEGLEYCPPDGDTAPRVLSLRVLQVENGVPVASIGLVDVPVGPEAIAAAKQKAEALDKVEGELSRVRTALNAQELKLPAKPSEDTAQAVKRALADVRGQWEKELEARLAEASSFAREDIARAEARLRAEHDERVAEVVAQAESDVADARENWRREAQAALAWKTAEEKRVAELEAQWREQLAAKSTADAEAAVRATSAKAEAELGALRQALSDARTRLSERDSEIAQVRVGLRKESEKHEQERSAALAEAQTIWRETETARLTELEKSLRDEALQQAGELKSRAERAEAQLLEARMESSSRIGRAEADATAARDAAEQRLSALTAQFGSLNKTLATRDREVSELRAAAEVQRRDSERALSDALERAEAAFREDEMARLAAAKTEWRKEFSRAEAGIEAERDATRTRHAGETARLQEELAALRLNLADRETELSDVRADAERTRQDLELKAQYDLRQAEKVWKSEEAARLTEVKSRWRSQSSRELDEATRRYQEAETALAQQRAKLLALQQQGIDADLEPDHLRREITLLQNALAACEQELAQLRSGGIPEDPPAPGAKIIPWPHATRDVPDLDEDEEAQKGRGLMREALALAATVVIVIFTTPSWITWLPYDWQVEVANATGLVTIVAPPKPAAPKPVVLPPAPVEHATVTHAANMRADMDPSSKVVATAEKGDEVVVLAHQDKWARIRLEENSATPIEGWVHAANLKE